MAPPEGANSIEWPIEMARASEAAARAFWPLGNTKLEKRLPLIEAPTLVLWGEADRVLPPSYAKKFAAGINGADTGRKPFPMPAISPISTSRRRSQGRSWPSRLTSRVLRAPSWLHPRAGALLSGPLQFHGGTAMTMRSIKWAAAVRCAMLVLGASLPAYAQAQVQAVPRAGVSFANTVTVRGMDRIDRHRDQDRGLHDAAGPADRRARFPTASRTSTRSPTARRPTSPTTRS